MANYWGTLALSYPCEIFEEKDYLLVVMHHSKSHNYLKAFNSKGWDHAMAQEMDSILKNRTWSLVGLLLWKKLINVQWVYDIKATFDGKLDKFKVKLVAKTYEQKTKFDLDEIFVLVIQCNAMRSVMALLIHKKCELLYLDVKMVFFNGDMKKDVFTIQTKGF